MRPGEDSRRNDLSWSNACSASSRAVTACSAEARPGRAAPEGAPVPAADAFVVAAGASGIGATDDSDDAGEASLLALQPATMSAPAHATTRSVLFAVMLFASP